MNYYAVIKNHIFEKKKITFLGSPLDGCGSLLMVQCEVDKAATESEFPGLCDGT